MERNIDKKCLTARVCFGISVVLVFLMNLRMNHLFNDDIVFSTCLEDYSLRDFLFGRYMWWSSRIFIEAVTVTLCRVPIFVWQFLNTVAIILLAVGVERVCGVRRSAWGAVTFLLLFFVFEPVEFWTSAGYIASSTVYLWTASCGVWALIPLRSFLNLEKRNCWIDFLLFPVVIYAANAEQMCGILCGIYVFVGGGNYLIFVKKEEKSKIFEYRF